MARGLGPVPARRHVAPAPLSGARFVVEDPATGVVGADPEPAVVTATDLADDRLGDPGEDVVDRVPDVAVAELHAVVGRDELESGLRLERPVDLGERVGIGRLLVGDRVRDVAKGGPRPDDAIERRLGARRPASEKGDPPLVIDDVVLREPRTGAVESRQTLDECTVLDRKSVV